MRTGDDDTQAADSLSLRQVSSTVIKTLWSSKSATAPAPSQLELTAAGSRKSSDAEPQEVVMEGVPRLEVGHTYIAAVSLVEARCSPGDEPESAHYEPLGENALVPFDDGVIGAGEVEGVTVTAAQAAEQIEREPAIDRSVADLAVGRSAERLVGLVNQATPTRRKQFSVPAPCS